MFEGKLCSFSSILGGSGHALIINFGISLPSQSLGMYSSALQIPLWLKVASYDISLGSYFSAINVEKCTSAAYFSSITEWEQWKACLEIFVFCSVLPFPGW